MWLVPVCLVFGGCLRVMLLPACLSCCCLRFALLLLPSCFLLLLPSCSAAVYWLPSCYVAAAFVLVLLMLPLSPLLLFPSVPMVPPIAVLFWLLVLWWLVLCLLVTVRGCFYFCYSGLLICVWRSFLL